jgi:hypothetical protein
LEKTKIGSWEKMIRVRGLLESFVRLEKGKKGNVYRVDVDKHGTAVETNILVMEETVNEFGEIVNASASASESEDEEGAKALVELSQNKKMGAANITEGKSLSLVESPQDKKIGGGSQMRASRSDSHAAAATRKKRKADDEGNAGDGEEDSNRKVPVNILMPKSNNENGGEGMGDDEVEDDEVKRMKWKVQTQMAVEAKRQKYTRLAEDRTRELEKLCRHISALKELQAKLDEKNEQKVAIENEIKAMSTYLRERQSADVMDDIDKEFTDALQAYDSKVEEVKEEHANIVKRLNEMREWADRFTISVEGVSTPSSTLQAWGKSLEFDVWLQMALRGAKKLDFENEES